MQYYQFILLAERYYKPTEALPSGRSPMQKFFSKSERLRKKGNIDQSNRLEGKFGKVKRGADNPELDTSSHPDLEIKSSNPRSTTFYHKPSGIAYNVIKTEYKNNKSVHSISWGHVHDPKTDKEKRKIITDAGKVWKQHIEPRLPYGSTVHNTPISNEGKIGKNTRAKVYRRYGFGGEGEQYGKVGRMPSPKQGKRVNRIKPMDRLRLND